MPRIACLFVPDWPLASIGRATPDLIDLPVVVTNGSGPQASIVAASPAARARGIRAGRHSVAQARAITADLVVRPRDDAAERSAMAALVDVAASVSPRVEPHDDGCVFLDVEGTARLTASETSLATILTARATRVGLDTHVGVGTSMTVARLAAQRGHGVEVVPAGTELGFLAPLPLACLDLPADIATTLTRWGIHRLGDLARLPIADVATRLGSLGATLVRRARGIDDRPLAPHDLHHTIDEAIALDWPIDNLEPLQFVLRGLVDRVLDRLGLAGIGCTRLRLEFRLDDGQRDARVIALAAPTRDAKTLLVCLRAELEARPPQAAILAITIAADPERLRAVQLGLFTPPGPAPERLATTLARLGALCGIDRIGTPRVADAHQPALAVMGPFTVSPHTMLPPADDAALATGRLVVRAVRPPRPIHVLDDRGRPCLVRGDGFGGRVVGMAGPWRLAATWWSDTPCRRDYWDIELSDGGIYRCFCELPHTRWFVDGVYD